ncbi:hypothetical protein DAQ1742_03503 [Dickeya aquatica]|uniref:Uncharacterized protein n=1 Tax=Dickeya aquatica TaxID=1401087 RepID=A0A375AE76_9GAMM|nr:hypothetical protein DAQ1742_03503 [Dickeya aquatica]
MNNERDNGDDPGIGSAGTKSTSLPQSGKKEAATLSVAASFKGLTDKH